MKTARPPRLALALLQYCAADNEPLVGDLLEQFAANRSRLWFWRQALVVIAVSLRTSGVETHPLHLEDETRDRVPRALPRRVNLSASPLPDVGGLGILVLILIVAMVRPQAWWMLLTAVLGGAILGLVLVVRRRRSVLSSPGRSRMLFP